MNFALRSFSKMVYIFTPAARDPFHRSACAVRRRIRESPVACVQIKSSTRLQCERM